MGEAAERLSFGPMPVGKDLGDEHPNDCSLPDGVGRDEAEQACGHYRKMLGEECPGGETERQDVSERADVEQRAPAQAVDEPETDEGEDQVGQADADRLKQGGPGAEAGQLKD